MIMTTKSHQNSELGILRSFKIKPLIKRVELNKFKKLPSREIILDYAQVDFKYFQAILQNQSVLGRILDFLSIESLGRVASVNSKMRMIVKHYILNYQREEIDYGMKILKKTFQYEWFRQLIEIRQQAIQEAVLISKSEFEALNGQKYEQQLKILHCGLMQNGFNVKISDVTSTIKKEGIKNCLKDIFDLHNTQPFLKLKSNTDLPNYVYSKRLSKPLNKLLQSISNTIMFRSFVVSNDYYIKGMCLLKRYSYKEQMDKLKKEVVKLEPLRFREESKIYQYLNKNILSSILSFLDFKEIFELRQTSQVFFKLIDNSLDSKICILQNKREEEMKRHNIGQEQLEKMEIYHSYVFLFSQIKSFSYIQYVANSNIIENTIQKFNDITKNSVDFEINETKKTIEELFKNYTPEKNSIIDEEVILWEYKIAQLNKEYLSSITRILEQKIQTISQKSIFHRYLEKVFLPNKEIVQLQWLMNKSSPIPFVYSFSQGLTDYSFAIVEAQKMQNEQIADDFEQDFEEIEEEF